MNTHQKNDKGDQENPATPEGPIDHVLTEASGARQIVRRQQNQAARQFQKCLVPLEGKSLEFDKCTVVVHSIQETLNDLKVALACPQCGQPAKLRCVRGRGTSPSMYFEHYLEQEDGKKKTVNHGGASAFRKLIIVTLNGEPLPL